MGGALLAASAGAEAAVTLYGRVDTDIEYQRGPRGKRADGGQRVALGHARQ
ncbi:hypothetical protein ACTMU2_29950 [Cupriavidus basilensis]